VLENRRKGTWARGEKRAGGGEKKGIRISGNCLGGDRIIIGFPKIRGAEEKTPEKELEKWNTVPQYMVRTNALVVGICRRRGR